MTATRPRERSGALLIEVQTMTMQTVIHDCGQYRQLAIACYARFNKRGRMFTTDEVQEQIRIEVGDAVPADARDVFADDLTRYADERMTGYTGRERFADRETLQAERQASPYRRLAAAAYQRALDRGEGRCCLDDVRAEVGRALRFPNVSPTAKQAFIDGLVSFEDEAISGFAASHEFDWTDPRAMEVVMRLHGDRRIRTAQAKLADVQENEAVWDEYLEAIRAQYEASCQRLAELLNQ